MINEIGTEQLLRGWGNWSRCKMVAGYPGKSNFHSALGDSKFVLSDLAAAAVDAVVCDLKGYDWESAEAVRLIYVEGRTGGAAAGLLGVSASRFSVILRCGVAFVAGRLWESDGQVF